MDEDVAVRLLREAMSAAGVVDAVIAYMASD
jgi:hypothetical protein